MADDVLNISAQQTEEEKLKEEETQRRKLEEERKRAQALNVDVSDSENSFYSEDNFKIMCHSNSDGSYSGITTDGRRLRGENFEDMNDQACLLLKERARKNGKEPAIRYNGTPRNAKKAEIFCRNAVIKFGITIRPGSDVPENKEFWKELQSAYLANGGKPEDWARMTRFVPDNVMGRSPEEAEKNAILVAKLKSPENNKFSREDVLSSPVRRQNLSENVQRLVTLGNGRLHT